MLNIVHHLGNTNSNHNEIPHLSEWLTLTSQATRDVGEDAEREDLFCISGWECKLVQPLWKTVQSFLKKLKIELPYDPAMALLGIYPRDTHTLFQRDTCTPMFIAALSTIAKVWKEPKCPSMDEWIKKMWSIYTMEHYSAIKKNEILPFATTWMELEANVLSEISQRKTKII